jgi:RNA polymerase sigma factor (sigma-70 family)
VDAGGRNGPTAADLHERIRIAQRGDADAFRSLYRELQPRLLRYLRALVGDEAEDVASETWLQVARDLPGFAGDFDGFRGWVITIARHRAVDHIRRLGRRPLSVSVTPEDLACCAPSSAWMRRRQERCSASEPGPYDPPRTGACAHWLST